jgi:ribose transport system ATP-binding protein
MATSNDPVLVVEGLCKSFHHQPVLRDVDLDVRPGEVHALLGANGSGKSTLIKVVAGIHAADSGTVAVDGERITRQGPAELARRGVRFVHQDGGLVAPLTVAENLLLEHECPTTRWGTVDRTAERAMVAELLGRMKVRLDPDRPVATLRAVERSAVSIGRALAHPDDLRLLVLDEPTAALPAAEVATLFALVARVVAAGASVLYVTHRLDEVLAHADRATVLRDGRRVATSEVRELDAPTLARLIVGPEPSRRHEAADTATVTADEPAAADAPADDPATVAPRPGLRGTALAVTGMTGALLADVSLSVAPGEVVGIAGLNGSGRDEVPRVLCGLAGRFSGLRLGDGPVLGAIDPHEGVRLGLVLVPGNRQPGSAVREFTVRENLGITSLRRHRRRGLLDVRRERRLVERWIAELDIRPADPDKPFSELSGGNQQKVILAKWLAVEPSVVILDEPTAGVDVGARQSIYDIVRATAAAGVAFVVCSADDQDHVGMADRVVLVADGRVVGELRPPHITEHEIASRLAVASTRAGVPA